MSNLQLQEKITYFHHVSLSLESVKADNCKWFSILNLTVTSFINDTMRSMAMLELMWGNSNTSSFYCESCDLRISEENRQDKTLYYNICIWFILKNQTIKKLSTPNSQAPVKIYSMLQTTV